MGHLYRLQARTVYLLQNGFMAGGIAAPHNSRSTSIRGPRPTPTGTGWAFGMGWFEPSSAATESRAIPPATPLRKIGNPIKSDQRIDEGHIMLNDQGRTAWIRTPSVYGSKKTV
jgi:hypothetical protein